MSSLGYGPGVVEALGLITDDFATLAGLTDAPTARTELARRAGMHYHPADEAVTFRNATMCAVLTWLRCPHGR